MLVDALRHRVVATPVRILGPGIEAPLHHADLALARPDKHGPVITGPDAVGWDVPEGDAFPVEAQRVQDVPGPLFTGRAVDEDSDLFRPTQLANDLAVDRGDGGELAGPVVAVVWPGDPGRFVGFPFRGHAEAKL